MEEPSNEKIEEDQTKIVETENIREVGIVDNSKSTEETRDGNDTSYESGAEEITEEKSPPMEDYGVDEERKEFVESSIEEVTANIIVSSEKSDDSEAETEQITNEINGVAPDEVSRTEETLLSAVENDGVVSDVASNGPEETKPPSDVLSEGIEGKTLPSLDENVGISPALTDMVESKSEKVVDIAKMSDVVNEESLANEAADSSNNAPVIGSSDGSPANSPIISLRQRTMQTTSWRSCCGLFEVLRRSNR